MATSRATVEILALLRDGVSTPLRGIKASIAATFGGLKTLVGGGLAATFLLATKNVADTETALLRLARTTRASVEEVSVLKFALDDLGVGSNNLKELLNQLEGKRADALRGGGQARSAFSRLGLDLEELKRLGGVDILRQLGDAYLAAGQSAQAAAQLQAIFGDRFREFLPLLAQGTKGFEQLAARAKSLGAVITGEDAANAEKFSKVYLEFATVAGSVFRELANSILPKLTDLLRNLRSLLGQDTIQERARRNALADLEEMRRLNQELGRDFTGVFSQAIVEAFKEAGVEFERISGDSLRIFDVDKAISQMRTKVGEIPPVVIPAVIEPAKEQPGTFLEGFRAEVESTEEALQNMFRFGAQVAKDSAEVLGDNLNSVLTDVRKGVIDTRDAFAALRDGIIEDFTALAQNELIKRFLNMLLGFIGGGAAASTTGPGGIKGAGAWEGAVLGGGGRLIGGGSGNKRLGGNFLGGPSMAGGGGGTVINLQSNMSAEEQQELVGLMMRHQISRKRQVRMVVRGT